MLLQRQACVTCRAGTASPAPNPPDGGEEGVAVADDFAEGPDNVTPIAAAFAAQQDR